LLKSACAGEGVARQAALRLLPGIEPQRIHSVLDRSLASAAEKADGLLPDKDSGQMDMPQVWRAGLIALGLYRRMPAFLRQPAIWIAKRIERRMHFIRLK
jgi:hypothetical protein